MKRFIITIITMCFVFISLDTHLSHTKVKAHSKTEFIVFCAPFLEDPYFESNLDALADLGATAMHGPCNLTPTDYTPLEPGTRYSTPEQYLTLVQAASARDMKVVVYDKRIWSTDAMEQLQALTFWGPYFDNIQAWDIGDEPNIYYTTGRSSINELPEFSRRWKAIQWISNYTGIQGFTNIGVLSTDNFAEVTSTFPGMNRVGFNGYETWKNEMATKWFRQNNFDPVPTVGTHGAFFKSPKIPVQHLNDALDSGANAIVLFPGMNPLSVEPWSWHPLVVDGMLTEYGEAFKQVIESRT